MAGGRGGERGARLRPNAYACNTYLTFVMFVFGGFAPFIIDLLIMCPKMLYRVERNLDHGDNELKTIL